MRGRIVRTAVIRIAALAVFMGSVAARADGVHDFDFNFGVWKTHIRRLLDPLSDSSAAVEMNGTVSVRKVWDGRAQLEEIEADGSSGHFEGLTLFLFNPQSHQWSQTFINSAVGSASALTGSFKDGRGELFAQESLNGRSVLVRGVWSDIKPDSHHFEQDYSADGGKSWKPAFIAELTRLQAAAPAATLAVNRNHDFDPYFGSWKEHSTRLLHPLADSHDWIEMSGATAVSPVWGGRANLAEFEGDGPNGHLELLALRVYNPSAHQWMLNFATSNVGTLGSSAGVGEFNQGRIDFYDQEAFNGRQVLVRFSVWQDAPDTAQSEQAFSDDGGKSWEVNWINHYTR